MKILRQIGTALNEGAALIIVALICWLSWQSGGVDADDHLPTVFVLLLAAGFSLVGLGLRLFGKSQHFAFPLAALVLVCWFGWGELQTLSREQLAFLPTGITDALFEDGAHRLPGRLSIAPVLSSTASTRTAMLVLAFLVGVTSFRRRLSRGLIWACLGLNGAVIALDGLAARMVWVQRGGWDRGIFHFGPFFNRNNASGFLNLAIAATLGLMVLWGMGGADRDERDIYGGESNGFIGACLKSLQAFLIRLTPLRILTVVMLVILTTGVLATLSRGGVLGLHGGFLIAAVVVFGWQAASRAFVGYLLIAAIAVGGLHFAGVAPLMFGRMATLTPEHVLQEPLIAHWQDSLTASGEYWPWGSGGGTYRYAFLPYQDWVSNRWYHHAENQPLEVLLEHGLPGAVLMALSCVLWVLALRNLVLHAFYETTDLCVAGGYLLGSQAIQSLCDFGPHLLPIGLTEALILGGLCGASAQVSRSSLFLVSAWSFMWPRLAHMACVLCIGAFVYFRLGVFEQEARVEPLVEEYENFVEEIVATPTGVPDRGQQRVQLEAARDLANQYPDDFRAQRLLARRLIEAYRLTLYVRLAQTFGLDPESMDPQLRGQLWDRTSLEFLHARMNELAQTEPVAFEQVCADPVTREYLVPALAALHSTRQACAVVRKVDLDIAALSFLDGDPVGHASIQRALQSTPGDPQITHSAAVMAANAGLDELANQAFATTLRLAPEHVIDIASTWYLGRNRFDEFLTHVLPDHVETILTLLSDNTVPFTARQTQELVERAQAEHDRNHRTDEADWHAQAAQLSILQHDHEAAVGHLRDALLRNPEQYDWRQELARLLFDLERWEQCQIQLRILERSGNDERRQFAIELLRQIQDRAPLRATEQVISDAT